MVDHPLESGPGSALGGPPGEVREAGLPPDVIRDVVCSVLGRLFSHAVRDLIAPDACVRWSPSDADLVAVGHQPCGYLDDGPNPVLSRAQEIRHSLQNLYGVWILYMCMYNGFGQRS